MPKNIFLFFQSAKLPGYKRSSDGKSAEPVDKLASESAELKKYYRLDIDDNKPTGTGYIHYNTAMASLTKEYLSAQGKSLDLVIGLCDDNENAVAFKGEIDGEIKEKTQTDVIWIEFKNSQPAEELLAAIICDEHCQFDRGDTVYIASNGGYRNLVTLLMIFSHMLSYKGIKTVILYSSEVENKTEGGPAECIKTVDYTLVYLNILCAVDLFIKTGNPEALKSCFSNCGELDKLFAAMEQFFRYTQTCKPVIVDDDSPRTSIVDIFKKVNEELDALEKSKSSRTEIALLKEFIPTIREKLHPLTDKNGKPIDGIEFLQIIKWCLDNKMIACAYFIFDAEFPVFFLQNQGKLKVNIEFPDRDKLIESDLLKEKLSRYKAPDTPKAQPKALALLFTAIANDKIKFIDECDTYSQLRKFGFSFRDDCAANASYLIGYVCLANRIRNAMAHSSGNNYIQAYFRFVFPLAINLKSIWDECTAHETRTQIFTTPDGKIRSIDLTADNYYDVITFILTRACDDIGKMLQGE